MSTTMNELLAPLSPDEMKDLILRNLQERGFPATAWQSGDVPRTLVEVDALVLSELLNVVRHIAGSGFLKYAEGDWLRMLAEQFYGIEPRSATFAIHLVKLTDSGGIGPMEISPGDIWVESDIDGRRYVNSTGGTLPRNGSLSLHFRAEQSGADIINGTPGTIINLVTPIAGLDVENVEYSGGNSLVFQSVDDESDESIRQRCLDRWPSLGEAGATAGRYREWARTASPEVSSVRVESPEDEPGTVLVLLAGPNGELPELTVAHVASHIESRRPMGDLVLVKSVENFDVNLSGTAVVQAAHAPDWKPRFVARLRELSVRLGPGGSIYRAAIISEAMAVEGTVNFSLESSFEDLDLDSHLFPIFDADLISVTEIPA